MIQINPLKSYIDGGVRAALTTPPSASLVFDLPGKAIWVKGVKLKGTDHTYTFSHDNYITLTNTPDKNNPESEDIKIGVNITTLKNIIDTTYNGGTLALLLEGLNTEERTWLAKILHNYINDVLPVTKNLKINGTNYAIYTTADSLPLFFVPTSLGATGQILACTSSGLIWIDLIQNTDYRVSLSSATSNSDYRIILKQGADNNPETNFVRFSEYLTFNPSTKTLKINNIKVITATDIYVGSNAGLVPAATSAQLKYYLRGDGTWVSIATEMATANTWRPIKIENTDALGSGTNTGTLSFTAGTGITLSWDATNKRIIITNSSPDVNHNTDETVRQIPKTDNVNRPLMMINGGTSAGEQINTSMFSTSIYANTSTKMITANGFIKNGSSNNYILLGGGGHKAVSNFATSNHNHYRIKLSDDRANYPGQLTGNETRSIFGGFMQNSTLGISNFGKYSDVLVIRSYNDSSGGNDNAIIFNKNTRGVWHTQFGFGSTTSWGTPYLFLDSNNFNKYTPTLTGTGASGTWDISITGNAATATNADKVDGYHASYFWNYKTPSKSSGDWDVNEILGDTIAAWAYGFDNSTSVINGPVGDKVSDARAYYTLGGVYCPLQLSWHYTDSSSLYTRTYYNGKWYSWNKIAFLSDIPTVTDYYWANVPISATSNTYTSPTFSTAYTSNWFRSTGDTGWYSETYGGGWRMTDTTYIRVYGSKLVYNDNTSQYAFYTSGGMTALGHMWSSSSAQSWLNGQKEETAALNIAASSNTSSYWPWFRQTLTAASKWISVGTHDNSLYFIGSTTSRTENSYDYGFIMNFSNGYLYGNFAGYLNGNASSATKLTSSAGNATLPIYFSGGKPVSCTASSLFSNLSNSGNNISVTVAGQNRILTVGYADYATCAPAAANWGGTGSTTKIKVKINSATSWMLSFVVTLYQDYKATKIMISGYNYGSNYWHEPEAVLLGDSNGATSISVYFGYDSAYNLWVGFDGGSYTGVSISDVTNGYTQISSLKGLFTISNVSSLTTLQKTVTATNSVNYANSAGSVAWDNVSSKPTTLSGYGITDGLYSTQVSAAQDNITWAKSIAKTHRRAFYYNTKNIEYSYLFGFSSSNTSSGDVNYGAVLKMGYTDSYLRILRVQDGNWKTTDWEKISAGYADSAGNADTVDGLHVHSGRNNEANKIVRTDGSGYILAGWINTTSGDMGTTVATRVYCSNDAYIRYKTLASFSSDIAGQLYWANVKVSTSSNAATSPTFGSLWINNSHFFKLSGTTFTCPVGITFTLPLSGIDINTALLWTTASDISRNTGIFYNSSDFAFIANSNDHGAVFAVYDTNVTQDFEAGAREISVPGNGGALWARGGFSKSGSSNDYVLLGGGGHKAISDFSMSHSHPYLPLSGGTITGMLKVNAPIFGYVYGTSNNRAAFIWDKPGSYYTGVGANGSTSTILFSACNGDGTWVNFTQYWVFKGDVTASNFYSSSDIRLKNNINNISKSIRSFNWKESGLKSYGLIALEIENEYPELVSSNDNGYKSINYTSALCMLVAKLENGLDKLKEKVKLLEDKLCKYENTL